ncbi:hypothetical protein [Streptomyces pacificus]|uniref:Uncharacterized protein n=1 Tax=Streptomyces pacificus TaxID=2705029 RepID=A0A6A0AZE6_9ACTN|nr:hypothetical protein [Streptomyces pacificus]GFH37803.1 hypothetical protein SCWH03_40430 [Streptomyces pacificus]
MDDDLWALIEPLLTLRPERASDPRPVPDRRRLQGVLVRAAQRQRLATAAESELFEILRRYQGSAESEATPHAKQRMALYQIMEKYNSISRSV